MKFLTDILRIIFSLPFFHLLLFNRHLIFLKNTDSILLGQTLINLAMLEVAKLRFFNPVGCLEPGFHYILAVNIILKLDFRLKLMELCLGSHRVHQVHRLQLLVSFFPFIRILPEILVQKLRKLQLFIKARFQPIFLFLNISIKSLETLIIQLLFALGVISENCFSFFLIFFSFVFNDFHFSLGLFL